MKNEPFLSRLDRRRFLAMLGSAGAVGVVGCSSPTTLTGSGAANSVGASGRAQADSSSDSEPRSFVPNDERTLVVVELQGGNDGLAMLQPLEDGRLQDMRVDLVANGEELVSAGDGFGWHPNLAGVSAAGAAAIVGVGSDAPDFSHFEMEQRWWRGDSSARSRLTTGFFGRLCDQLDVGDPVTGISLSGGPTPALMSEKSVTVGLTAPDAHWFFREQNPWLTTYRETVAAMAVGSADDREAFEGARKGLADTTRFAESIASMEPTNEDRYPWTDLGQQLRFAHQVMALDAGVRVLHVQLGGFDTHSGQEWRHADLMSQLNEALAVFTDHLRETDRYDSTLIVTTSEFGRRVEQNDGGTDHGGASTMLLCGSGLSGVHGVAPDLTALDDGNVVATARFEDYYATIAEDWFEVPAAEVLPSGGERIPGVLA